MLAIISLKERLFWKWASGDILRIFPVKFWNEIVQRIFTQLVAGV